jgi:nicotinamidase-related amidase
MSAEDLHGNVPDKSSVVLLLIDVINDLDFPEGRQLFAHAQPMARSISRLVDRARQAEVPVIYVNDNFGRWRSDFKTQVEHCLEEGCLGRPIAEMLRPRPDDYFILKPKHSGFFCTTLDLLLRHLQARTLILTGIATDICVLFTANDAYLHGYEIVVPRDCVAANTLEKSEAALDQIRSILKARVVAGEEIGFDRTLYRDRGVSKSLGKGSVTPRNEKTG